jgi:hypothetical protein
MGAFLPPFRALGGWLVQRGYGRLGAIGLCLRLGQYGSLFFGGDRLGLADKKQPQVSNRNGMFTGFHLATGGNPQIVGFDVLSWLYVSL